MSAADPITQLCRALTAEAHAPIPAPPGPEDSLRTVIATLAHMLDDHDRAKRRAA